VGPGIAGKGDERLDLAVFDGERVQIKDSELARAALETTKPADEQTVGGLRKSVRGANLQTPQTLQTSVCSRTLSKGRALASRMAEATGRTR
jgi:CxxC motif-containing protein